MDSFWNKENAANHFHAFSSLLKTCCHLQTHIALSFPLSPFFPTKTRRSRIFVAQPLGTSDRRQRRRASETQFAWECLRWLLPLTAARWCSSDMHQLGEMSRSGQRLLRVAPRGFLLFHLYFICCPHTRPLLRVSATSLQPLFNLHGGRAHFMFVPFQRGRKRNTKNKWKLFFLSICTFLEYVLI